MDTQKSKKIRMRGHHLFCVSVMQNWTLWGPPFWENVKRYKKILEDPDTVIEIVRYCCDTCIYCPCNIDGKCDLYDFREGGNRIDLEILGQLGLEIGQEITSGRLRCLIAANFPHMPSICDWGCGVTDSGCSEGFTMLKCMD